MNAYVNFNMRAHTNVKIIIKYRPERKPDLPSRPLISEYLYVYPGSQTYNMKNV